MITPQNPFIFRGLFILYIEGFLLLHGTSGADTDGVFVMVGDLVTLHISANKNKQSIKWYFNDTCVAQMKSELKICADDQCHDDKERFRDRLELDSQTGSLTIMNIRITDSGLYTLQINSISEKTFSISVRDVPAAQRDEMESVKEGESVTLYPGVIKNNNDSVTWYFNDIGITKITGGSSNVCTDEQCTHQYSELRNRLEVNNQTGSLTIMNTRTTDAGLYHLEISSSSSNNITISSIKTFSVTVIGDSGVETDGVSLSVMEGDSVTLQTGIKITQDDIINWHFNDILIAQMNRDLRKSFTYYMRFRDRLKLDIQTGSLTIMNITITDAGLCILEIISSRISEKIFRVSVREAEKMKMTPVKEGESIILDSGEINTNVLMTWYFNDSCIAEISGDPNKMCTDDQCEDSDGRFRDRLKLDHQTGSLTITNTRTTDSGVYKLEINSSGSSIHRRLSRYKSFSVAVIDSGQSEVEIYAGVFSAVAAAMTVGVICCRRSNSTQRGHNEHHVEDFSPNMAEIQLMTAESSPNQTETASATSM